jgi:hypothetical protein
MDKHIYHTFILVAASKHHQNELRLIPINCPDNYMPSFCHPRYVGRYEMDRKRILR